MLANTVLVNVAQIWILFDKKIKHKKINYCVPLGALVSKIYNN